MAASLYYQGRNLRYTIEPGGFLHIFSQIYASKNIQPSPLLAILLTLNAKYSHGE